ncbi:MAG: hypothetical protein ACT4OP_04160 [Actinomycetota bacterium]
MTAVLALLGSCAASPALPPVLVVGRGVKAVDPAGAGVDLAIADPSTLTTQAIWAPNGDLAVWTEIGAEGSRIAMGNAESQRRLDGGTAPFFYSWNPDGSRIAYLGNAPDGEGVALGIIDVAQGSTALIDAGTPYYLDWSPDGERLVVHSNLTDLYYMGLEGARTAIDVVPGPFQAPAFLPDGRILILQGGADPGLAIVSDSGASKFLAPVLGPCFFSPARDGSMIAYTDVVSEPPARLSIVSADGGDPVTVSDGPVVGFQWSPTRRRLLFITIDREAQMFVPHVWDEGAQTDYEPFRPTESLLRNYLPFWDQFSRVLTVWSPDDENFLVPAERDGGGVIIMYTVGSPRGQPVVAGEFASWAPRTGG